MALDPLATAADLTARRITFTPDEEGPLGVFLATASAAIREAAGCPISQVTSTVALEGHHGQRLHLPGGPVTAVSTVVIDGLTVTDWRLRSGLLWRGCGWQGLTCTPSEVTVTYTHGLPEVPADIVDLACRLATATLVLLRADDDGSALAVSPGVTQERIDDYSVSFDAATETTEMELSDRLRQRLAARFGNSVALVGLR